MNVNVLQDSEDMNNICQDGQLEVESQTTKEEQQAIRIHRSMCSHLDTPDQLYAETGVINSHHLK